MPKAEDIPECPAAVLRKPQNKLIRYEFETVTIMVGGGAVSGQIDDSMPIRATSIRGSLRYFWRLPKSSELGDRLKRREEEIFGSTDFPSPLVVTVEILSQPIQIDPKNASEVPKFGPIAYALFPSIENNQNVTAVGLRFAVCFQWPTQDELDIRRKAQNKTREKSKKEKYPDTVDAIDEDIKMAISAWIVFGGIGGRTRRGCGAITCRETLGKNPKLPARIFMGPATSSATEAWGLSLSAYRDFRQTPRGRKHKKTLASGSTINVPGRSHWPEADSIRAVTGCSLKPHRETQMSGVPADEDTHDHSIPVVPIETLPAFPKAVLGLPINFHFADGPRNGRGTVNKDPKSVQLYPLLDVDGRPTKCERMASPVFTRPLWIDGKWRPAIVILDQVLPRNFQVRLEGREATANGRDLVQDFPDNCVVSDHLGKLRPMLGKYSAIDALIEFIHAKPYEFQEVTL